MLTIYNCNAYCDELGARLDDDLTLAVTKANQNALATDVLGGFGKEKLGPFHRHHIT